MTQPEHVALTQATRAVHALSARVAREGYRALGGSTWLNLPEPARDWIRRHPDTFDELVNLQRKETIP